MVDKAYRIEAVVFQVIGALFFIWGVVLLIARCLPHNRTVKIKLIQRHCQWTLIICGILMVVWQVDPRHMYGIYPIYVIVVLKDAITLVLMCAAIVYTEVMYNIVQGSLQRGYKAIVNFWLGVGLPFVPIILIQASMTTLSFMTDREIYRSIFFGFVALYVFINSITSVYLLGLVVWREWKAQTSFERNNSQTNLNLKWKLVRSSLLLLTVTGIQGYITGQVIRDDMSMTESQTWDPENYSISVIPIPFTLALCIVSIFAWIPICPSTHHNLEDDPWMVENRNKRSSTYQTTRRTTTSSNQNKIPQVPPPPSLKTMKSQRSTKVFEEP
jgi:hypothetical protein